MPPSMDVVDTRQPVPWEWFDTLVVFLLWSLLQVVVVAIYPAGFSEDPAPAHIATAVLAGATSLLVVSLAWAWWRGQGADGTGGIRRLLGVKPATGRDLLMGLAWGVGGFVTIQLGFGLAITTIIEALGREVPPVQVGVQEAALATGSTPLLLWLGAGLIGPMAEELLFRGFLYQGLAKRLPGWPAVGLSGLAFALLHLELLVIGLTFPFGMLLAYTFRRYGTLVVPVTAHVVFNLIALALVRAGDGLAL